MNAQLTSSWLLVWMPSADLSSSSLTCSSRCVLRSWAWLFQIQFHQHLDNLFLPITGRVRNEILAKCNACYTYPCSNEGTCEAMPERQYKCRCTPGYHGNHCQYMIDACYGNPCRNQGTCRVLEEGRFRFA